MKDLILAFDGPEPLPSSLAELRLRLGTFERTTTRLYVRNVDAIGGYESAHDFFRHCVEVQEVPAYEYAPYGNRFKIVVPEDYALKLESVRQFRLALEGAGEDLAHEMDPSLLQRALPEDFLPHLDALPKRQLLGELLLLNEANPLDPLYQDQAKDSLFESQASTVNDRVTFFKKNLDPCIGDELQHEWSHLAWEALPTESSGFALACLHEGVDYSPRAGAEVNDRERWAVLLGEEILRPHSAGFFELTRQAPLQSIFLAMSLERLMESDGCQPEDNQASCEWLRARVNFIQEKVKPGVLERLISDAKQEANPARVNSAARLLIRLGQAQLLDQVTNLTSLDLAGEPVGFTTLKFLQNNQNITELNLNSSYAGSNLEFLENMPLKKLSLAGTRTRSSALCSLELITTLEWLDLSGTEINSNGIPSLRRIESLRRLDLTATEITASDIEWLQSENPSLVIHWRTEPAA